MVSTAQRFTSCMKGNSLKPWTTASLCISDHGRLAADGRDLLAEFARQVEVLALPVARQVLRAARDRAVLADQARAADADERREADALLLAIADLRFQHFREPRDQRACGWGRRRHGATFRAAPPSPSTGRAHACAASSRCRSARWCRRCRAPGWRRSASSMSRRRQVHPAEQPAVVGLVADARQVHPHLHILQDRRRLQHRALADVAFRKAAADHDALDALPRRLAQEASG